MRRLVPLQLLSFLSLSLACGPIAPTGGESSTDPVTTTTDAGSSTTLPTTGITTTGITTTGTTTTGDSSSSGGASSGDASSGGGSSSGGELDVCWNFCQANEHCTPEARQNATITGTTPLGDFTGTFAAASSAIAFGELGRLVVVPEYLDGSLCEAQPRLVLDLGAIGDGETFVVEAPARYIAADGQFVDATAEVTVHHCCDFLWFCQCANPAPFDVEVSIQGDGWSLAGAAAPNCCRSHSVDEAA